MNINQISDQPDNTASRHLVLLGQEVDRSGCRAQDGRIVTLTQDGRIVTLTHSPQSISRAGFMNQVYMNQVCPWHQYYNHTTNTIGAVSKVQHLQLQIIVP
jgi:hypothetical protein